MSLLQSPRRPSSDVLALGSLGRAPDPDQAFSGGFGDHDDGPRVDLGRELDLSSERPHASAPVGRGAVVLAASIAASALVLAGIIMLVRGDTKPTPDEPASPAAMTEVVSTPELPVEAVPAAATPAEPPPRVATQRVPAAAKEPEPAEITPTAIAPASASRPSAPSTVAGQPSAEPGEVAPTGGLAPGLHLPAPIFDDPEPATPEPVAPEPTASPTEPTDEPTDESGASNPLPGIDERPPAEPQGEPKPHAPEPSASEPAEHSHAEPPAPVDVLDLLDRLPARADRPAS